MKRTVAIISAAVVLIVVSLALSLVRPRQETTQPFAAPPQEPLAHPAVPSPSPADSPQVGVVSRMEVGDLIKMVAALDKGALLKGTGDSLYLQMDLDAQKIDGAKRLPMNVSIVVDRSGSMSGERIERAKEAAKGVLKMLQSTDRVSLITYATEVTVVIPSTTVDAPAAARIMEAIDSLSVGGTTNLSGGLLAGRNEVSGHLDREGVNRVVLISDGIANEGITSLPELSKISRATRAQGLSVTTIGVGLDFNEKLLMTLADTSGGNYYYVRDAQALAKVMEEEFKLLAATVARDVFLLVEPKEGVTVTDVLEYDAVREGRSVRIPLGAVHAGQHLSVLAKLEIPNSLSHEREVVDVRLSYVDAVRTMSKVNEIASLGVMITEDAFKVASSARPEVQSRVAYVTNAMELQKAIDQYEAGNVNKAKAVIQAQINNTKVLNRTYKDKKLGAQISVMEKMMYDTESAAPQSSEGRHVQKNVRAKARMMAH